MTLERPSAPSVPGARRERYALEIHVLYFKNITSKNVIVANLAVMFLLLVMVGNLILPIQGNSVTLELFSISLV